MCERELRAYVKAGSYEYIIGGMPNEAVSLLAADPDVVKMLRWVTHQLRVATETGARIPRQEGMECGYQNVIGAIEAQFHVRLTDDGGYEYSDDA